MKPGDRILIDDGSLELAVEELSKQTIRCRVVIGGTIRSHKGMNLPGGSVSAPAFGEKDQEDMSFGLSHGVEDVGLSFVRGPGDGTRAQEGMEEYGAGAALIAKIERPEAVERL